MSELLTPEEGEAAVNEWVNEDWATRYIQLNRGHWEYIVPVIAKAQLAKQGNEEAKTVKRFIDRGWTPPEEMGMKIEQAKKDERDKFKAEVDKLTVISWERMRMALQEQDKLGQHDNMFRLESIAKAQLQHDKDTLN